MSAPRLRFALAPVAAAVLLLSACTAPAPRPTPSATGTAGCGHAAPPAGVGDAWRPRADGTPSGPGIVPLSRMSGAGDLQQELDAAPVGGVVALPRGRFAFSDFTQRGGQIGLEPPPTAGGLVGSGAAATVLAMRPHSSTRAGVIPTAFPQTNPLSLLRVTSSDVTLGGFSLVGTAQGHLYNGLRVQQTRSARISDLCVADIPGDDKQPPGETFGIDDFRTVDSVYRRIEVDGGGVGGAGFGANVSHDVTIDGAYLHDQGHSAGATFFEVDDIVLRDVAAVRNANIGLNFERVGGTVEIDRPVLSGNGGGALRIASDFGSARFTIRDPVVPRGGLTLVLPTTYDGRPNLQRLTDVQVLVDGVDRTAAMLHVVRP